MKYTFNKLLVPHFKSSAIKKKKQENKSETISLQIEVFAVVCPGR